MERYLKEIGKIKVLSKADEQVIAKEADDGNRLSKDNLIRHNLRYVVEVAKSYQGQGLPLDELIAEGNLGLCKAANKFDYTKNIKFITYAVWWIRQSILQALSDNTRLVRIPINKINEIQKSRKLMIKELQTDEDYVSDLDNDLNVMYSAFPVRLNSDSVGDQPILEIFPDENAVPPDKHLLDQSLRIDLDAVLDNLTAREIEILKYYHGLDEFRSYTLEEIGNILGLTRERIRQIKKKSLKKIRRHPKSKKLLTKYK